ncbi:MAG: TonB-dependent receptor [Gammaproteobacteria bacterium]|nr:TonB-dependent receptor [Gammaproteobacteria bacterium]
MIKVLKQSALLLVSLGILWVPVGVSAQDESASDDEDIEEVVVTAQRKTENIQDVPLSVSAFTESMLEDQQIINPSDIQMNTPSVSYSATNFGGFSFSVRGIGSLVVGSAAEPGVSAHLNEIPVPRNLNTMEFFDLERVEILRGPQGTLFGKNATGGAINFVTRKPEFDKFDGFAAYEFGTDAHSRFIGMFNMPIQDGVAARFAFMSLERDGYTENLADGLQLWNVDDDIDGRDQYSVRFTLSVQATEHTLARFTYSMFEEDSDRARITNQICERNNMPTTGCTPNGFGFETPHLGATTGGIFGGAVGAIPIGVSGDPDEGFVNYRFPRPDNVGFRAVHTDFEPVFEESGETYSIALYHQWQDFSFDFLGAISNSEYKSNQDYIIDVGATLGPTALNPLGYWPTSRPSGGPGEDWAQDSECRINGGTAGVLGGCILSQVDGTRIFTYDQSDGYGEYWVGEFKVRSELDGDMNFLAGFSSYGRERITDYYVLSNTLDLVSIYGAPLLGLPPLYPGYFLNSAAPGGEPGRTDQGSSVFGEVYYTLSDDMNLTVGLRYNEDEKETNDTSVLFNAINHLAIIQYNVYPGIVAFVADALGVPPEFIPLQLALGAAYQLGLLDPNHLINVNAGSGIFWSRTLNLLLGPFASGLPEVELARYYGVTQEEIDAALLTPAYSPERVAISNSVPIVPQFGEARALTNSPSESSWTALTGRAALDYKVNEDILVYASISTGYKPGGLNAAIPTQFQDTSSFTFDREDIFALEVGTKSYLADRTVKLNGSFFTYRYNSLQVTRIKNNSAIQDNIDANIWGLDLEGWYRPPTIPNLSINYAYGFLNTAVDGTSSLDPINRTAGDSNWVLLNNIDAGALTGVNYIARKDQITQAVIDLALATPGATADIRNGLSPVSVSYPDNEFGVSIPAYFSRSFLAAVGVETSDGLLSDLDGNELPNSPAHTMKVGLDYAIPVNFMEGTVVLRWDMYWQSESFSREFNTPGDRIDAWTQHNLSALFTSGDDKMSVRAWIRNVADKDNVTGMYLTSDTSGFFRNYFLTEPQIMGLSIRYSMN